MNFLKKNVAWIVVAVLVIILAFVVGQKAGKSKDSEIITPGQGVVAGTSQTVATNPNAGASGGHYDYTDAPNHIGENASISGTVLDVYTAKSGVTFLDFCSSYKNCPFSAVVFASDATKFPDLKSYVGKVTITGLIKSYQGKAEIILNGPDQIQKN